MDETTEKKVYARGGRVFLICDRYINKGILSVVSKVV